MIPERVIYLALPTYGGVDAETMLAVAEALRQPRVFARSQGGSLLAKCFNAMWCEALNTRAEKHWTHFVMLHSDIAPESGWLTKLLDEMDRVDADVISAVSPIKDNQRITSTALLDGAGELERLDEHTLRDLPATFDGSRFEGKALLINTGLMAVRFDQPWVEECHFEIRDSIERQPDGTFEARGLSEDWNFSSSAASSDAGCLPRRRSDSSISAAPRSSARRAPSRRKSRDAED